MSDLCNLYFAVMFPWGIVLLIAALFAAIGLCAAFGWYGAEGKAPLEREKSVWPLLLGTQEKEEAAQSVGIAPLPPHIANLKMITCSVIGS